MSAEHNGHVPHEPASDRTSTKRMTTGEVRLRPPDGVRVFVRPGGGFDLYLSLERAVEWGGAEFKDKLRYCTIEDPVPFKPAEPKE
jgi:hypothetical protein